MMSYGKHEHQLWTRHVAAAEPILRTALRERYPPHLIAGPR